MLEEKQDYFDVQSVSQAFARVGEACAKTMNSIISAFKDVASRVLNAITPLYSEMIKKRISRKRFIKLLMADGIQRNEAQRLALKYHKEQGYYCMFDVYKETKNKR